MMKKFVIDGQFYHDNKKSFKKLLAESGLFWNWKDSQWQTSNQSEVIKFACVREINNDGKEFTKEVTLLWKSSKETALGKAMSELFRDFQIDVSNYKTNKLKEFDRITALTIEQMRKGHILAPKGAPEGFINAYRRDREEQRQQLEMELDKLLGGD